jgi:uncharacterized protein YkwD
MPSLRGAIAPAVAVILALLALPSAASARQSCRSSATPAAGALDDAAAAVVCEINAERARRGLRPLDRRPRLDKAGSRFAKDMVERRFFAHTSPEGRTLGDRLRAADYVDPRQRWIAGEALAWGWGGQATPAATVRAWIASPPHRRLLLDRDYRHIGIGVALGAPVAHPAGPDATYAAELATRW